VDACGCHVRRDGVARVCQRCTGGAEHATGKTHSNPCTVAQAGAMYSAIRSHCKQFLLNNNRPLRRHAYRGHVGRVCVYNRSLTHDDIVRVHNNGNTSTLDCESIDSWISQTGTFLDLCAASISKQVLRYSRALDSSTHPCTHSPRLKCRNVVVPCATIHRLHTRTCGHTRVVNRKRCAIKSLTYSTHTDTTQV
jgi:hypothetical protein